MPQLAQHAHSHHDLDRTHSLIVIHFRSTQLQPHGAKRQLRYYFSVHAGSFRVSINHRTLTWTTGSLSAYVIILVHVYTHRGWAHWQWVSTTFLTQKNSFLCSWWDSNLHPLDLQFNALPIEPPRYSSNIWYRLADRLSRVFSGYSSFLPLPHVLSK